jgi:hypothetical protein
VNFNTNNRVKTPLIERLSVFRIIIYQYLQKHFRTKKSIKVITKLPNSEQSYIGKVKTHNYIHRQNQSTTGKL